MKMDVTFHYTQEFLPTKRHRNERSRDMVTTHEVEIREIADEKEFPVALRVTEYASFYRGAKTNEEIRDRDNSEYVPVTDDLRFYGGKLWKAERVSYGAAVSDQYEPPYDMARWLINRESDQCKYRGQTTDYDQNEIVAIRDNRRTAEEILDETASNLIVFDGKLWRPCCEPRYEVTTFGLGNNHGGTGLFIVYCHPETISSHDYSALERDEAIADAVRTAKDRGDTNDVERLKNTRLNIEVLMPETVTPRPGRYRVWAKSVSYCYLDVDAASEEEAFDKANGIDGGMFTEELGKSNWEMLPNMTSKIS